MKSAALALERIAQPVDVGRAVLVVEKASCPIVPALDDVQRQAVDVDKCTPRHGQSAPEIEPGPFFRGPFFRGN
jgi:hypothetical protein